MIAPPLNTIIMTVATATCISVMHMLSERRQQRLARPRQIAMWLARELTPATFPEIGRAFHRDHTTILHGCARIDELITTDADIAAQVSALRQACVCAIERIPGNHLNVSSGVLIGSAA